MTWVIGMPGFISRGILIGDVRITLEYPGGRQTEFEGVRKIYAVAPNIAMGFAGNIDTGLKMVSDFARYMRSRVPDGHITYEPSRAIFAWARRARYVWQHTLMAQERDGECSLIFVAALAQAGPFTSTVAYTLHGPEFTPTAIQPRTARSIGSGAHVPEYVAEVEQLAQDYVELAQFETMYWDHTGGAAMAASIGISDAIDKYAVGGISPHLHICSVKFGVVEIGTNDRQALTPGVESRTMPPVAESWDQWQAWKKDHGAMGALAVGGVCQR